MVNTIIAFDFGLKRIGVAVGKTLTKSASPLKHFLARDGIPNWDEIAKVLSEWNPELILVGYPLTMEGDKQQLSFCAKKFANRLWEKFKIPVEMCDERLTTLTARSEIFQKSGYRALKKGKVDSFAAKIILEDWFLMHQNSD